MENTPHAATSNTSSMPPPPPIPALQHHHAHDPRLVQPSSTLQVQPAQQAQPPQIVSHPSQVPPQQATLPRQSPKRVRLNPSQKEAVLALLASGAKIDYIVETFGIAKRTVFKIQRAQRLKEAQELQDRADASAAAVAAGKQPPVHPPFNVNFPSNDVMQDVPNAVASAAAGADISSVANVNSSAPMATPALSESNAAIPSAGAVASMTPNPQLLSALPSAPPSSSKQLHAAPKKSSPPAKRVRLNVSEKLDICNFIQQGGSPADVIQKYGISRRTFFKILHDEQDIRQTVDRDHVSAETKSIRPPHFPLLDQSLSAFVLSARAARIPLNWHMVREQALRLRTELLESGKERPERIPHLERFTASEHWCQLFMRKNASKKLPAALEDPVQPTRRYALKETKHMQSQLAAFHAENVYTLVTPRLYYRYIPPRMFGQGNDISHVKLENIAPGVAPAAPDGPANLPGRNNSTPAANPQEPFVNLMIAANLAGTKRLPVAMIVPPSLEKMFDTRRPCLPCIVRPSQKCDSVAFSQWLRDIFIPHILNNNRGKVALMIDETLAVAASASFGQHDQHVSFIMVPRLSICMSETARNGIFPLLVARYRFKMYETYSALIPLRETLRAHASIIPTPHRGLAEGHVATIYDAADILREAWVEFRADRIARSWWRMNVLPESIIHELEGIYGPTNDKDTITEVSGFVLNIVRPNPVGKDGLNAIANGKARWISVVEVIRWFTYEYEMLTTTQMGQSTQNIQNNMQNNIGHNQAQHVQGANGSVRMEGANNNNNQIQQNSSNGLDWNSVVQQGDPMGNNNNNTMPCGPMPGSVVPIISATQTSLGTLGSTVADGNHNNNNMNVGATMNMNNNNNSTGEIIQNNNNIIIQEGNNMNETKETMEEFGKLMKSYADTELGLMKMQSGVEALRVLRNSKKIALSQFVANGAAAASNNSNHNGIAGATKNNNAENNNNNKNDHVLANNHH